MGLKVCCMRNHMNEYDWGKRHEILYEPDENEAAVCEVAQRIAHERRRPKYESAKLLASHYSLKANELHEPQNTFLATHLRTGMLRQMVMHKKPIGAESQKRLKWHMNRILDLKCEDITAVFEVYEDYKNIYMIQEYLSGGTCNERILERMYFTEQETTVLIKHMLLAIKNLHGAGLSHGNLYPGSFRFLNDAPQAPLKMDDFGLQLKISRLDAQECDLPESNLPIPSFFEMCKLVFVAPEHAPAYLTGRRRQKRGDPVFTKKKLASSIRPRSGNKSAMVMHNDILSSAIDTHLKCEEMADEGIFTEDQNTFVGAQSIYRQKSSSADIWSIGTIAFLFLCGYPAFFAPSRNAILGRIHNTEFSFDPPFWSKISEEAKDFVRGCLKAQYLERFTVQRALEHPWISTLASSSPSGSMFSSFMLNLRRFHRTGVIEMFAVNAMTQAFSPTDLNAFLRISKRIDTIGSGFFTVDELQEVLIILGHGQIAESISQLFERSVRNPGSSYLDYAALYDAICLRQEVLFEEYVWQAFSVNIEWDSLSSNQRAAISTHEIAETMQQPTLQKVLQQSLGPEVAANMSLAIEKIERCTKNDQIEFYEFLTLLSDWIEQKQENQDSGVVDAAA